MTRKRDIVVQGAGVLVVFQGLGVQEVVIRYGIVLVGVVLILSPTIRPTADYLFWTWETLKIYHRKNKEGDIMKNELRELMKLFQERNRWQIFAIVLAFLVGLGASGILILTALSKHP